MEASRQQLFGYGLPLRRRRTRKQTHASRGFAAVGGSAAVFCWRCKQHLPCRLWCGNANLILSCFALRSPLSWNAPPWEALSKPRTGLAMHLKQHKVVFGRCVQASCRASGSASGSRVPPAHMSARTPGWRSTTRAWRTTRRRALGTQPILIKRGSSYQACAAVRLSVPLWLRRLCENYTRVRSHPLNCPAAAEGHGMVVTTSGNRHKSRLQGLES